MSANYFKKLDRQRVRCTLCPNNCIIAPGKYGSCLVRRNLQGELTLPYYGAVSSLAIDPIEKKPLYHFYPGEKILSVGFLGCNLHCPFCQNYQISQSTDIPFSKLTPTELVGNALKQGSFAIAYTYSEPLIHFEYVLEAAQQAHEKGLKNVLVSNGYLNQEPASELLEYLDAANIDLKSFNPDFYRREIGGKLSEVKRFITQAAAATALEVTTLIIPGKNDTPEEIAEIAAFLATIDRNIPYHLSAYYPQHHYHIPPTPISTLTAASETAAKHLNYVYLGNVGSSEINTLCPECRSLLIRRRGYSVQIKGIKEHRCSNCGNRVPIRL